MKPSVTSVARSCYRATRRVVGVLRDRSWSVDTTRAVDLADLGLSDPHRVNYEPSGWLDLRRILWREEIGPEDVFLDLGSGKGRAVLLAARHPFGRVIGVELSDRLNAIARRNLAARRHRLRCRDVELVTADVVDYRIPDDVSVVYIFNAFGGPVFDAVIEQLVASVDRHPRTVRLIYQNAREHERLMRTGRFRLMRVAGRLRPGRDSRARTYLRLYVLEPLEAQDERSVAQAHA